MRDMAPRNDRSIRNIPVSSAHRRAQATRFTAEEVEGEEEAPRPSRRRRNRKGMRLFIVLAVIVAFIFGVGGVLLSTLFVGASVTVYPRTAALGENLVVSAQTNAPTGILSFQTMTITSSATTSVNASGSQKVSRQASGIITITNNFSGATQRLIANTRFEAPDGKIYRIHDSVSIPGNGTATITVYADSPGEDYNRGATRFTVPGFKSDPRYTKIYAEATSLTGGYIGTEPAVAAADLAAAKTAMQQKLEETARGTISSQLPEGFILVSDSFQYSYSDIRQIPEGTNKASITQSVTAVAAIVRATDLASALARQAVQGYGGEAIAFKTPGDVRLTSSGKPATGKFDITVTGAKSVIWLYDKAALKSALVGKKKDAFESIITSFRPAITKAEAKVRPFWLSSFPSDPDKITLSEGESK